MIKSRGDGGMRAMMRTVTVILALGLAGCVTHMKNQDQTIVPSKEKLGTFATVLIKPVTGETAVDPDIIARVETNLSRCMPGVFQAIKPFDPQLAAAPDNAVLLIEPSIVDAKKVSVAQRVFFRALAGSSAALLRMRFTDVAKSEVVAEPIFYSQASAASGALTFGSTDYLMYDRLADQACDYSKNNL